MNSSHIPTFAPRVQCQAMNAETVIFGMVLIAFCVWLCVWIVNQWAGMPKWALATAAVARVLVGALAFYFVTAPIGPQAPTGIYPVF